jgi:hypothetical protein
MKKEKYLEYTKYKKETENEVDEKRRKECLRDFCTFIEGYNSGYNMCKIGE